MADNYQDIGSGIDIFPFEANWASEPDESIVIRRDLQKYPGSTTELAELVTEYPIRISFEMAIYGYEDIYNLIDFWNDKVGRRSRFWIKSPKRAYTVARDCSGLTLYMKPNVANQMLQGHERIYIEMSDGDILTHKINAAIYNEVNDEVELTMNTTVDRMLTTQNTALIGRIILGRFDIDTLKLKFESNEVCTVKVDFVELAKEYSEI